MQTLPSNLTRTSNAQPTKLAAIHCSTSGLELGTTLAYFGESVTLTQHPIFTQTYASLERKRRDIRRPTHAQRSLLTLASLLHSTTCKQLVTIKHPIILPEHKLAKQYRQLCHVADLINRLPTSEQKKLCDYAPAFSTNAVVHTSALVHATAAESEWQAVGSQFIDWVLDALAPALETSQLSFTLADPIELELAKLMSEELRETAANYRDTAAKAKQAADDKLIQWNYIIAEIASTYDLTSEQTNSIAAEITQPTDAMQLGLLDTYLTGLENAARHNNKQLVTANQYLEARLHVAAWQADIEAEQAKFAKQIGQLASLAPSFNLDLDPNDDAPRRAAAPAFTISSKGTAARAGSDSVLPVTKQPKLHNQKLPPLSVPAGKSTLSPALQAALAKQAAAKAAKAEHLARLQAQMAARIAARATAATADSDSDK